MELDGLPSTVMPPSVVTLTFDLFTPKSYQHVYAPKYTCDQNWVKLPSLVFEILCSQGFQNSQMHRITDSLTHSQTRSRTHTSEKTMPPAPKVSRGGCIQEAVISVVAEMMLTE